MDDGADADGTATLDEEVLQPANAEVPEPSDLETLRATREEARAILDHKLRLLDGLDEKAMRIVRTAVVVLGVLVSGAGVVGPARLATIDPWPARFGALGVGFLLVTVLLGVGTSTDSPVRFGPDAAFRTEARENGYTEREWLLALLDGYDEWIDFVDDSVDANATRLLLVQGSFAAAVLAFVAAVGLSVMAN